MTAFKLPSFAGWSLVIARITECRRLTDEMLLLLGTSVIDRVWSVLQQVQVTGFSSIQGASPGQSSSPKLLIIHQVACSNTPTESVHTNRSASIGFGSLS